MQVNLISPNHPATQGRGVVLNETRTITFGIMATPAKPQPSDPVNPRANWPPRSRVTTGPAQASLDLIGNSMFWGSDGNDNGFYPWNHNYSLWHYWESLRGGASPGDFADGWTANLARLCLEGGNHTCPPGAPPTCKTSLTCELAGEGYVDKITEGLVNSYKVENNFVVPYTNTQSICWDADAVSLRCFLVSVALLVSPT